MSHIFPSLCIITRRILSVILLLTILLSCNKNDIEYIPVDKYEIISIMQQTQTAMKAPGWMVSIETPSVVHEYSGGYADPAQEIAMQTDDLIRIGSITKTFTATLALILCDEGLLSLNDILEDHYPEFPESDKITIRHLLEHTSGITTWDENEEIRMQIYEGTGDWTIDKLIEWAWDQQLLSEPGEAFHYSNIGYFLLGKIMESVSQESIQDLLQEKICIPLGFKQTFMPAYPHPDGDVIHGFDESGGTVEDMSGTSQANSINFELAWTAGGIMTTLEELTVWARALATGFLLSDSLHLAQLPVLKPPTQTVPYWSGYGMGMSQTDVWMGHTGAICGFVCNMQYYPDEDVSIITFFNKFSVFDPEANTADLKAEGENFMTLARFMCPETLQ